jgi:YD repeat-containing protein
MAVTGIGSAAAVDPVASLVAALANAANSYVPISSAKVTITYNTDGTVATVTETTSGAVTTYTYNADGTPATESRVLSGVTTTRTFAYTDGNLTGVS